MAITDAMTALGRVDSAAQVVPNPQLLTRFATRSEAIGTAALEGTFANLSELFAAETADLQETDPLELPPNIVEVLNYTRAAELAYGWINERPITEGLLSSLQAQIVRGVTSDSTEAGSIRSRQVFIGTRNRPITEARYVPPPAGDLLRSLVDGWIAWLNDDALHERLPLIARIAMAHYQFEAIHPYVDGNGRVGRLVAALQLLESGQLTTPVLSLSTWLQRHGDEYRDGLLAVSASGDWVPWVAFIARGIDEAANEAHTRIVKLLSLREELGAEARRRLPRARLAIEIADNLIAYPFLTVSRAQSVHGKTNQANRNAIQRLCEIGLLEPYGPAQYGQLYWNRRVIDAIEQDD